MTVCFLTYDDESGAYTEHTKNLTDSLKTYSPFVDIEIFRKSQIDESFKTTYANILNQWRGGGYWLWKPYAIIDKLRRMNHGDILIYMDSTYVFTSDISPMLEHLQTTDMLVFSNKPREPTFLLKNWCKTGILKKYGMIDAAFQYDAKDCWGGFMILKKTDRTIQIIQEWFEMCCDPENITDIPCNEPNAPEFRDHRHDQSLLTIICIKYGIEMGFLDDSVFHNIKAYF